MYSYVLVESSAFIEMNQVESDISGFIPVCAGVKIYGTLNCVNNLKGLIRY
ncbi:hypothetical protein [Halobacillus halophilus]|uniref:hypothetical protein n=1 Tax=Halobacillus halophilus TaxID=1570 RepID=UPI0002D47B55|nr:hypothetical protein [Halobacillus halophilus]